MIKNRIWDWGLKIFFSLKNWDIKNSKVSGGLIYRNYRHNNKYNNNNNKSWTFCLSVLGKDLFTNSRKIFKDRLIFIPPKISLKLYTNVFYILCTSLWCQIPYRSSHNYDQWLSEKWRDTRQNHALKTWRIFAALRRISNDLESTTYIWGGKRTMDSAGAIYLFYLGWLWTGIGDLDGLVGRQPPGVPLDVDAGVHSGLLLRLPCPSSFLTASFLHKHLPKVPRVTPGPLLGPRSYTSNPQFLTWNKVNEIGSIWAPKRYKLFVESR